VRIACRWSSTARSSSRRLEARFCSKACNIAGALPALHSVKFDTQL
jgi:hypothetical protein